MEYGVPKFLNHSKKPCIKNFSISMKLFMSGQTITINTKSVYCNLYLFSLCISKNKNF